MDFFAEFKFVKIMMCYIWQMTLLEQSVCGLKGSTETSIRLLHLVLLGS